MWTRFNGSGFDRFPVPDIVLAEILAENKLE
jgi:hypothetical protein